MSADRKTETLTFTVPADVKDKLVAKAKKRGITLSELVRESIPVSEDRT